jgi:hypothetical protein
MYVRMYYVNYKLYLSTYYHVRKIVITLFSEPEPPPVVSLFLRKELYYSYVEMCDWFPPFDSNSSGIFQIPRVVELRNSIPHFPLGMEMEPTSIKIIATAHYLALRKLVFYILREKIRNSIEMEFFFHEFPLRR